MRQIFISILVFILSVQVSWAQIPQTISYQGFLTDAGGTSVSDGSHDLMFVLYDSETSGSAVWTETHSGVPVKDGVFSVVLGSVTSLGGVEFDQQYWLGVTVDAGTEMTPRTKLTASAYSLNARSVADDAVTSGKILNGAISLADLGQNGAISDKIMKWGGGSWVIADDEKGIDGAGTVNRIPKFIGLATLGDSEIYESGGKIGIGLTGPGEKLTVGGTIHSTSGGIKFPDDTVQTSAGWSLIGNAGTTQDTNFLGTTDDQALELWVNNLRALRLEPHADGPNIIGGSYRNWITSGVYGATIAGGGGTLSPTYANRVTDKYGTVCGGEGNQAGDGMPSSASHATVGGGYSNDASAIAATVSGGQNNDASGNFATVGGGQANDATASYATVPGGYYNTAAGRYSFAAGYQARVRAEDHGTFVWSDNILITDFVSTGANRFMVRSTGGVYFYTNSDLTAGMYMAAGASSWTTVSDKAMKRNIREVDGKEILSKLSEVPISQWSYKAQDPGIEHIGPMAQDFYAAFGLGEDDRHINTLDPDGVALAAIQGLYELVKAENAALKEQLDKQGARLKALEELVLR